MLKALLPIFLIVLVDILGLTIVLPLLPFYAEKFGATPMVVGMIVTSYALCQLISGPILGQLSDRVGRRPILLVSQLGTFIGFLILAFSNTLALIFVARVIDGVTAGNLTIAQAYIADVTQPQDRAKAFGVIGISFGLGFLIGPALSGFLSQYGYHYPVLGAAFLSLLSIFATYFLLPKGTHLLGREDSAGVAGSNTGPVGANATERKRLGVLQWGAYADMFRSPSLSPRLIQFFFFALSFSLFISGFALFAERRFTHSGLPYGPKEVGYLFAYSGFLGIIIQGGVLGRLVKKYGEAKLVVAGFASAAIGYGMLCFVETLPLLLVASSIASFGTGVLRPALTSLVTQLAGRRDQGAILGLTQSLNSVAQIVAPMISGLLIEHHFLASWAGTAAGVAALGLFAVAFAATPKAPAT